MSRSTNAQEDVLSGLAARNPLARRVGALERQVKQQATQIDTLQKALSAEVAERKQVDAILQGRVESFSPILTKFSVQNGGDDIFITGANLHIVNGRGSTDDPNRLGNLIVGYNELREDGSDNRRGSHNLILGRFNNYLQFGGLVGGEANEVRGAFATVVGGHESVASGAWSTVTGGHANVASGAESSVIGGWANVAFGAGSSVTGGDHNLTAGNLSAITGGAENRTNGGGAAISGGRGNVAGGLLATVSGGDGRRAPGLFDWAAGGAFQDF
jgi:hypothetical protein